MKKKRILSVLLPALCLLHLNAVETPNYQNNRYPLVQKPCMELPLGSIKARGWLLEMLQRQRDGATGQLDKLYPSVMGSRNGWLGGDGDQWERGPYWIDGLLPLAYILDDKALKEKSRPWIEWALQSQKESGYFGPDKDFSPEPGLQRDNSADWWPRMVVLKILQQYYSATGDQRVLTFMTHYFRYQLQTLPQKPLGHWTFWAEYRVCDNLAMVYWLYNITGDAFLLDLGNLLHKQGYDFTHLFLNTDAMRRIGTIHCVNLAQGLKEPIIYYQQSADPKHIKAVKQGLADIRQYNGQAQGMYGGDEALHGNEPTQGSELCSAVELMYSLEKMMEITGEIGFADHLERIAFNALPTQTTDDYMSKQYFQQANQVMISRHPRNFDVDHHGTDITYGLLTGYPCCLSNMHQGWPKFTQNLFYASHDHGVTAMVYAPSEVKLKVGNGSEVEITEETCYPVDDKIRFTVKLTDKKQKEANFPFHLRIPSWCRKATIRVNGQEEQTTEGNRMAVVRRTWKNGDILELHLPMHIVTQSWKENSVSVERGPLVYALKMEEQWEKKEFAPNEKVRFGDFYYTVTSPDRWNYGLVRFDPQKIDEAFTVVIHPEKCQSSYPWNLANAPIEIKAKAKAVATWKLYNESAGPIPYANPYTEYPQDEAAEEITLIPYGCTTLRVSQFPIVR